MKNFSKLFALFLAVLLAVSAGSTVSADYNAVKPTKLTNVSKKSRTIKSNQKFELKVKANGDDDYLYWTIIKGKNIVKFNDYDRSDDDIELIAKKPGVAKVVCKIVGTNKKISFTIKVKKSSKELVISEKKAKSIAFKDAKTDASKVRRLKIERDNDNGKTIYEISFYYGRYEYDYEIDAKNGKIIEKDKEYID